MMQMGGKTAWFLGFTALGDVEHLKLLLGGRDAASSTLVIVFSSSLTLISSSFCLFAHLVWARPIEVRFVNFE